MAVKIKHYVDCYIPVTTCNLRCSYCYIAQQGLFKQQVPQFEHSPGEIRAAMSVQKLGGVCVLNLCAGGETLIPEEVIQIVRQLLEEGHFVSIVTNGTLTHRFQQLATFPQVLLEHLFIKFSFHYLELKRRHLFETYFANVKMMQEAGASFSVEMTPCDEEIPLIPEIKKVCMENLGALCHVTIARSDVDPDNKIPHLSKYDFDEYKKIWETFDSDLFNFKASIFYQKRREFCYAGDWTFYVNLGTGDVTQCYCGKKLGNLFDAEPLRLEAIGKHCTQAHCYNGHSWLAFGDIPQLNAPTYAQMRNRVTTSGEEWLRPQVKEAFSTKLCTTNRKYSLWKRFKIDHEKCETEKMCR